MEQTYQGIHYQGYFAALDDANNPNHVGIKTTIHFLADSLKMYLRQQHLRWVEKRYVDSADWELKYYMTNMILADYCDDLPIELRKCPAEQLMESIFKLLCIRCSFDNQLVQNPFE